jgi:phage gp29-like protein
VSILARVTWATERAIHAVSAAGERIARAARPSSTTYRQLDSWPLVKWTVPHIEDALQAHEMGNFAESAKLAASFGRDDRITACRNTRVRALVGRNGANFQLVQSTEGNQRTAARVKKDIATRFHKTCSEDVLSRIQQDAIDLGVSISRIHWTFDWAWQEWLPRLEPWSMEWVRWDGQKGCYVAQTADHGEVEVRPGTGEWLIVEPAGACGWMSGSVRALAMPYFFRGCSWKDWARYCEKHGVPILAIKEPPVSTDVAAKSTKDRFFASLRRLGREGILRLPKTADGKSSYEASILEPTTLSWPAFEAFLQRLDVCIAVFLLGQNLSTEVSGGSFAAAIAQNRIRLDYLAADAEALATALRSQVWMFWGRFNNDNWDDATTPWPTWTTSVPEDLKTKAEMMTFVGKAVKAFKEASVPVDVRAFAELFGVPVLSIDDALKQAEEEAKRKAAEPKPEPPSPTPPTEEKPAALAA